MKVFAGLYPADGETLDRLTDAFEKLTLNDASVIYQKERRHVPSLSNLFQVLNKNILPATPWGWASGVGSLVSSIWMSSWRGWNRSMTLR